MACLASVPLLSVMAGAQSASAEASTAIMATGTATCVGVSGSINFNPPITSSATSGSETATTTLALSNCTQGGQTDLPSTTVTGAFTSATTFEDNGCADVLSGTNASANVDWTGADPAPTDGIAPTSMTWAGTGNADAQNPSGFIGLASTSTSATGSYAGPSSATIFGNITRAQLMTDCGTADGVSTLTIASGVVSAGVTATAPAVTSAASTTFTEGNPGTFTVSVSSPGTTNLLCLGNLPMGITFVADATGASGVLSGTPLPGSAGTYALEIASMDGNGLFTSQPFTLTVAASAVPFVSEVSPGSGGNDSLSVTITGNNFTRTDNAHPLPTVDFGTTPATVVTLNSSTSITATEPDGAAAGPVDVTVTTVNGISPVRTSDEFTYNLPPQPPNVVEADPEGLGLFVSWAPNVTTDAVTSYTATASVAPGYAGTVPAGCSSPSPVTVSGSDTGTEIPGLCASVPYTSTVSATNGYGTSAGALADPRDGQSSAGAQDPASGPSNPAVPLETQPPSQPLITTVQNRSKSLTVSWNPPSQVGGDPVTSYELTAAATGLSSVTDTIPGSKTEFTLKKLANGATYDLDLTATSAAGTSTAAEASGVPVTKLAPGEPTGLAVVPDGNGSLDVSWAPPTDLGTKKLKHYVLTYTVSSEDPPLSAVKAGHSPAKGHPGKVTLKASVTSHILTGLSSGSYYDVSVVATSGAGTGPARTTAIPVTPNVTLNPGTVQLTAPTMAALQSDVSGTLTWPSPVPTQLDSLHAGNVLMAMSSATMPQGLLGLVQSVYPTPSGGLLVTTTDASPTQAFLTFSYSLSGAPPGETAGAAQPLSAGVVNGAQPDFQGSFPINYGTCSGDATNICVNSTFNYYVNISGSINWGCTEHSFLGVKFCLPNILPDSISLAADAGVGVVASLILNVNEDTTISILDFSLGDIQVGPISIVPKITINLKLSGKASLNTGLNGQLGGGFECSIGDNSGCNSQPDQNAVSTNSFSSTATGSGSGSAALDVIPQLCAYDALCVNVTAEAKLAATTNINGSPYFSLCPTISVKAGVNVNIFGYQKQWDGTIYSHTFSCATITSNPTKLVVSVVSQPSGTCNVNVGSSVAQLQGTRTDGASDPPVTFTLLNPIAGDSVTASGSLTTGAIVTQFGRLLQIQATDSTGLKGELNCNIGGQDSGIVPTGLVDQYGNDQETTSWTAPNNPPGIAILGYRVCAASASQTSCTDAAGTSAIESTRSFGPSVYEISVYAVESTGNASPPLTDAVVAAPAISNAALTLESDLDVVITGEGFGSSPSGAPVSTGCGASGSDYTNNAIVFQDYRSGALNWTAGQPGDCIGVSLLNYSSTQVEYDLGNAYGVGQSTVQDGDTVIITIDGAQFTEIASVTVNN
jgi:Fibronectin type III domain/Putative Ig domain